MPIYAYRCGECGHSQDVLQKLSDAPLNVCPACGAQAFSKQVTAAGFQLKGSGWYVTDFRGGNSGAKKDEKKDGSKTEGEAKPAEAKAAAPGAPAPSADAKPASPGPAPAPASPSPSPSPSSGS